MKIKNKITYEQADKLIDKYYDGFTNAEEEKQLQSFLSQKHLPTKYQPEQAIFGYFEKKRQKPRYSINKMISWSVAAAAVLILALSIQNLSFTETSNFAYIGGVKITNKNEIKTLALASLTEMSDDKNTVESCLDNLNNCDIQSQLEIFSTLGE